MCSELLEYQKCEDCEKNYTSLNETLPSLQKIHGMRFLRLKSGIAKSQGAVEARRVFSKRIIATAACKSVESCTVLQRMCLVQAFKVYKIHFARKI